MYHYSNKVLIDRHSPSIGIEALKCNKLQVLISIEKNNQTIDEPE